MKVNSTKLTVTKDVVENVRKLLGRKKIDLSITQFAEHILTEAVAAIESDSVMETLPTIRWIREKLGKGESSTLLKRLEEIEKIIQLPAHPKKLSA